MAAGGRRWLRLLWLAVGLLALLAVWVLLGMRWRAVTNPLFIAMVGVMPFLAVGPLLVGLLGAWWSRNVSLRVAAAVTLVAFVYTTSPVDAVLGCRADGAVDSGADNILTVYTANVWFEPPGGQPDQIGAAIAAEDPDIVFLQEVQWDFLTELQADPRLDRYVHRTTDIPGMPIQDLVWSKWPIEVASVDDLANARFVQATINTPSGQLVATPIHLQAPLGQTSINNWLAQHRLLAEVDRSVPRIMAGDFNATRDHQPFRSLLRAGWTDAHEIKGCGLDTTWPSDGRLPVPVMRLDHVLVTDHFEVLDLRLGDPGGSDHLPVISTLRFNPAE
ncbi:MAG: endonuclease/exonuclease/phosphatase family protein [Actinomycetota bacterium]